MRGCNKRGLLYSYIAVDENDKPYVDTLSDKNPIFVTCSAGKQLMRVVDG